MIPTIKAEFKKVITIRSTYLILLVGLLLLSFLSFYVIGFKSVASDRNSLFLAGTITQHSNIFSIFPALVALLLMAHEYRHNTIIYTLTASNSRTKVLAAKILTVFVVVFVAVFIANLLGITLALAGLKVAGHALPHQDINYLTYFAKNLFYTEAYALFALMLAALVRNLVATIAILFIVPGTIEGLLGLVLKHNSVYLPFTALQQVVQPPVLAGAIPAHKLTDISAGYLSAPRGALVFSAYLIAGWAIAWYLFLRRDAT